MKIFNLDDTYSVVCDTKGTRNGFKHTAVLCKNGVLIGETKINYLNRTWERFTYESVLLKIIDLYFEGQDRDKYRKIVENL